MRRIIALTLCTGTLLAALTGCAARQEPSDGSANAAGAQSSFEQIHEQVPYDAMLNLEVINGRFRFQRIATTPCIVYSDTPLADPEKGTVYDDRHDILTSFFKVMDGKAVGADVSECVFTHCVDMFDREREDVPWHYRFAVCSCGAVRITNHDEFLCAIKLSEEELKSILSALQ